MSYPTQSRLAKTCACTGSLAVALVILIVFVGKTSSPVRPGTSTSVGSLVFVALAVLLLIPILALWFALAFYRLVRPAFSAAVTPEGIVDHCSLIATGVGLIRWENVAAVNPVGYSQLAPDSAVLIRVRDPGALLEGRPWPVRMLRRLVAIVMPGSDTLFIFRFMIDDYRAGDLAAAIAKEYEARRSADPRLAALPPAHIVV